ncbi:MAG: ATP-dependent DNA helicase RecG, partial [Alphaproteobacteria bacterium]|nr:ATP-dependent DNA helicase RecG [Alphaproteobacteria bacterium]
MTGRPEVLFPLFGALTALKGVGDKTAQLLEHMAITRPRDMLFTLPQGGIDRQVRASIRDVVPPCTVTVAVTIGAHHVPASKNRPYRVTVTDSETSFQLVFFHARGDFLQRLLPEGERRIISGRIELFDGIGQ